MSTRIVLTVFLAWTLAACNVPSATKTPTPQPPPATETAAPPTGIPPLTLAQLQNAEINISGISPDANATRTVKLTDGKFEPSTDRASPDYVNINMGAQVAYGDLNGDGASDAAIIIGENYGGTGTFVSVVAMLNQNGQPLFAGSIVIDDRAAINTLDIQNGEILLDATIHGPNDPGCCPAHPIRDTLRLWGGKLIQAGRTSKIPDGTITRVIEIQSPAQDSQQGSTFTINGTVTIAPFENNLGYSIFVEGNPEPVTQSSIMVNATEMGGPGTFTLPLDLTASGLRGKIRIEISDLSAADGSKLAVATLFVTIP